MTENGKLGKRIAKYRENLGLTQEELAVNSGLEVTFLSDIENGLVYPPIGTMIKISRCLGQRVGTFVDDEYRPDPLIVRYDEIEEETDTHRGAKGHYHYYPLGKGKNDRHMEPMYISIDEGDDKEMTTHEGEEFMVVIKGKILLKYGKTETVLNEGDSIYYNSVVPHFVGAIDGSAFIMAVLYVPM